MKKPKTFAADAAVIDKTLGNSFPLGATVSHGGVNISVFSKNAEAVELLLFDHAEDSGPSHTIRLDPRTNRTCHYWHVFVPDIGPGQIYAYRVHGLHEAERGMRFDPSKVFWTLTGGQLSFLKSTAAAWRAQRGGRETERGQVGETRSSINTVLSLLPAGRI